MCVITVQKNGAEVSKDDFFKFAGNNPDGFGIMFVDDKDKLQTYRTMNKDTMWEFYENINKTYNKITPIVLHFRAGTAGIRDESNCHPFNVTDNLAFVHNGVFSCVKSTKEKSDTNVFNDEFCIPLGDAITNESVRFLLNEYVGHNKLVFLNSKKEIFFVNEQLGEWKNNIWYSFKTITTYDAYDEYGDYNYRDKWYNSQHWCDKCKRMKPEKDCYTIIGLNQIKHFICKDCITSETKIKDIVK